MTALLLLAFSIVAGGSAASASELRAEAFVQAAFEASDARLEARLLLHPDRTVRGTLRAGVLLTPDPGWSIAWRDPGDGTLATRLGWRDVEAGAVEWPAPDVVGHGADGSVQHGYRGDVLLVSELRAADGVGRIEVDVETLACATACVPVALTLGRDLSRVEPPETAAAVRRLFLRHAEARPKPAASLGRTLTLHALGGGRLALTLGRCRTAEPSCPALSAPRFAPASEGVRVLDAREAGGEVVVLLEADAGAPPRVEGVLSVSDADGRSHHVAVEASPPRPLARAGALAVVLLAAFVLGAVVNGLPSRIADLARASEAEPPARFARHALGVLASVSLLAGLALAVRFAAHAIAGADAPPLAIAAAFVCGVSGGLLFGAAFGTGLTTVLRDMAPLLASALALACFVEVAFVVAGALGLGLGLVAGAWVLRRRPAWLAGARASAAELRRLLGCVPLAGAAWLVVRLAHTAGAEVTGWALAVVGVAALVGYGLVRVTSPHRRVLVLALGASLVVLVGVRVAAPPHTSAAPVPWTPETFARLRALHRPLVVVYGADWCRGCRWNEEAVMASAPVRHALARGGYTVLRADWTDRGEAIRRELARSGRAAVPLTLAYPPGADPIQLPDVLTVDAVLDAL